MAGERIPRALIEAYFREHEEEFKRDLAELVAIPSVRSEALEGKPYGAEPARALEAALAIARRYGLTAENWENYLGIVEIGPTAEIAEDSRHRPRAVDILAHLDVVPADPAGWTAGEPFRLTEREGRLYGRGTTDDKGPLLAVLYALRALRDLQVPLDGRLRLVMGCDEENGSSDLIYYYQETESAAVTLTPDAGWPVINAEKGILVGTLTGEVAKEHLRGISEPEAAAIPGDIPGSSRASTGLRLLSVRGGTAYNAVPASCVARLADPKTGTVTEYQTTGRPAHASMPEKGENAVTLMIQALVEREDLDPAERQLFVNLNALFPHGDYRGERLGVACRDEQTGALTLSLDVLHYEEGKLRCEFDARLPVGFGEKEIACLERQFTEAGFQFTHLEALPHYVPEDASFIRELLASYELYTGEKGYCYGIGGLTYCHHVENGVAFGIEQPGSDHHIHGNDEYAEPGELRQTFLIYAEALARLAG